MVTRWLPTSALRRRSGSRPSDVSPSQGLPWRPTYMSPEQAAASTCGRAQRRVLARLRGVRDADRPAPGRHTSLQRMLTQKLAGGYTRLRDLRPDLPRHSKRRSPQRRIAPRGSRASRNSPARSRRRCQRAAVVGAHEMDGGSRRAGRAGRWCGVRAASTTDPVGDAAGGGDRPSRTRQPAAAAFQLVARCSPSRTAAPPGAASGVLRTISRSSRCRRRACRCNS